MENLNLEKRYIAIPRQLQLNDVIYTIVAFPLNNKTALKDNGIASDLEWFDAKPTKVSSLEIDPTNEDNILVNKKISLPANGELSGLSKVILNEEDAKTAILTLFSNEVKKIDDLIDVVQASKKTLTSLQREFKTKSLNKEKIEVEIVDERNEE